MKIIIGFILIYIFAVIAASIVGKYVIQDISWVKLFKLFAKIYLALIVGFLILFIIFFNFFNN